MLDGIDSGDVMTMRGGVFALAACVTLIGSACADQPSPPAEPTAPVTELAVRYSDAAGKVTTFTVDCTSTPRGSVDDPGHSCDLLADAPEQLFQPVPEGKACTLLYGGPEQARVSGRLRGRPIDSTFTRSDGCQIDRWQQLYELGLVPAVDGG